MEKNEKKDYEIRKEGENGEDFMDDERREKEKKEVSKGTE